MSEIPRSVRKRAEEICFLIMRNQKLTNGTDLIAEAIFKERRKAMEKLQRAEAVENQGKSGHGS